MADVLGSGVNRAAIHDRNGVVRLLDLPPPSKVSWGRVLNDVSAAGVVIPVPSSGIARHQCCGDLRQIHTWAHTLVIYRDGERVWEGPIIRVTHRPNETELAAWDVLGWTKKRRIRIARQGTTNPDVPLTVQAATEAIAQVQRAYQPDDPNVLAFLAGTGGGKNVDRDVAIDSGYYWDDLSSLTDAGVRLFAVGRRIVLYPSTAGSAITGATPLLLPENHLMADIEVVEDGENLATACSARDDQGNSAYYTHASVPVDAYYGLVETVLSSGAGKQRPAVLTNYATNEVESRYPAPLLLNIPDGATLRPDAPFPIDLLVPGAQVPVQSRETCLDVAATFTLTQVNVDQTGENGTEAVTITLEPVSTGVLTTGEALPLGEVEVTA